MAIEMLDDLMLCFSQKAKIPAVTGYPCSNPDAERSSIPEGGKVRRPCIQAFQSVTAPVQMIRLLN